MKLFVNKRITEAEMFERIKSSRIKRFDAIYFCVAFIRPEFRCRRLATRAIVKSAKKIKDWKNLRPTLFYWQYSKEGSKLAPKVAKTLGLEIKKRV